MEALAFVKELEVFGIPSISVVMLIIIMATVKKGGVNELLKRINNNIAKFWILTGLSLAISFGTSLLCSFPNFIWYKYLQNVLLTWIVGGFVYQKFKNTIENLGAKNEGEDV